MTAEAVYQAVDDPNDVTVTHEFATLEAAQAFAGSAELRAATHDAVSWAADHLVRQPRVARAAGAPAAGCGGAGGSPARVTRVSAPAI